MGGPPPDRRTRQQSPGGEEITKGLLLRTQPPNQTPTGLIPTPGTSSYTNRPEHSPGIGLTDTPPEYSPSFMIPSGPGGLQSAEPSPMDVLPRFQTVSTTTSPGIPTLTGDAEADRLIQQLVEAGDWTPLSNELSLLEPLNSSSSNFAFDASSLLNDLMACLTHEPGAPLTGDLPLAEGLGDPGPLAPPLLLLPLDVGHETTSQSGVTFREGGVQSVSPPSSRTRSSQPKAPARRFASGLPPLN